MEKKAKLKRTSIRVCRARLFAFAHHGRVGVGFATLAMTAAVSVAAQTLPQAQMRAVDAIVRKVLVETGVPSATVAVVQADHLIFAKGYGDARLNPSVRAEPEMRYGVGSISKEFAAACVLLLQQEGRLSLDDHVAKFFPELTRSGEVTIRQLLSHTSGYQDYYPQDYLPEFMESPTTPQHIMNVWGRKPLDFDPGTKWQYSNTNYVIAGAIVEKVAGQPLFDMLKQRVFAPLGMTSVINIDQRQMPDSDAAGYFRYALGPLHFAPKEANGWLFAAGELAMNVTDLMKWDISLIRQSILEPRSYREMETEVRLRDGEGTRYGLGLTVGSLDQHRSISHGGEAAGYTTENLLLPDDHIAVAVFTNEMAGTAAGPIAEQVARKLIASDEPGGSKAVGRARRIFAALQRGEVDRSQFTADLNQYFDRQCLRDHKTSLAPLGTPTGFSLRHESHRGGMIFRSFAVEFADGKNLEITTFEQPDGKLEQYLVLPAA